MQLFFLSLKVDESKSLKVKWATGQVGLRGVGLGTLILFGLNPIITDLIFGKGGCTTDPPTTFCFDKF